MAPAKDLPCPCGSKKLYSECCEPFISGKAIPATAQQLMRARYSAHVKGQIDFVMRTVHPSTRGRHDKVKIREWAVSVLWKRLDVLQTIRGTVNDNEGVVEFQAWYIGDEGLECLRERSNFAKIGTDWFYVDGVHSGSPKIEAHQQCPCKSGLQYSQCCG